MSGVAKVGKKLIGSVTHPVRTAKSMLGLKMPAMDIPSTPQVDDAANATQYADRIRRRKGVLANIFGGGAAATPSAGAKTLGGQ